MHSKIVACIFGLVISSAWTPFAQAGGQFVGDVGTQSMQRAGAFVAKADDPSAIFFNPAGIARAKTKQFQLGANIVSMNLSFDRFGEYQNGDPFPKVSNDGGPQPIPYFGIIWPFEKFVLAGGIFTPSGYGKRNLPTSVIGDSGTEQAAPQRYDAVTRESLVITPSAVFGYKINEKFSVGVRATWGYAKVDSTAYVQGVADPNEDPDNDSITAVSGSDFFVPSIGIGAHYIASPSWEFGASINSPSKISARGFAQTTYGANIQDLFDQTGRSIEPASDAQSRCGGGGTAGRFSTCIDVNLPATASLGGRYILRDDDGSELADLELDLRWENWSNASDLNATIDALSALDGSLLNETSIPHGLRDVFSIRLGASTKAVMAGTQVDVRVGVGYETGAAPLSWTRLDVDGNEKYIGALGFGVTLGRFRVDLGLNYIDAPQRQVRDVPLADTAVENRVQPDAPVPLSGANAPYNPINAGEYKSSYVVGSLGVTTWW